MIHTFLAVIGRALQDAGFEVSIRNSTITVAGCSFQAHPGRQPHRVRFLGSGYTVRTAHRFNAKKAVEAVIAELPRALEAKAERDKREAARAEAKGAAGGLPVYMHFDACYQARHNSFVGCNDEKLYVTLEVEDGIEARAVMDMLEEFGFIRPKK